MIINPVNGDIHDISSVEGKSILKKYIQNYNNGGSDSFEEELVAGLFKTDSEDAVDKTDFEDAAGRVTPPPYTSTLPMDRFNFFLNDIYINLYLNKWKQYFTDAEGKNEEEIKAIIRESKYKDDTPENREKLAADIAYSEFKNNINNIEVSKMIGGTKRSRPTELDIIEDKIKLLKKKIRTIDDSLDKYWVSSITPPPTNYNPRVYWGTDFSWRGEDPIDKYNKKKEVYINQAERFFTRGLNDGNLSTLINNATFTSMEELKELFDFTDEDLKRGKIDEELKIRLGEILALHYFDVEYLSNKGRSLSPTQATQPLMSEEELMQLGGMFGKFPPLPPVSMDDPKMLEDIARFSPTPFTAITSPIPELRDTARVIMNASPVSIPISDVPKANLSKTDLDALKLLDDFKKFLNRKRVEKRKRNEETGPSIIKPISNKPKSRRRRIMTPKLHKSPVPPRRSTRLSKRIF